MIQRKSLYLYFIFYAKFQINRIEYAKKTKQNPDKHTKRNIG